MARFEKGAILVTAITDPDWMPIMKRAAAIITDHGGRTSHAAIVSRELGLPAIVGTGRATSILQSGQTVTVSCAEGEEGYVYDGAIPFEVSDLAFDEMAKTHTKVMLNMANPAAALRWWRLPADGIGLARMEFIIGNIIKIHPMALVSFAKLKDRESATADRRIDPRLSGQVGLLCRQTGFRNRADCRIPLSGSGNRSHERFQDQRVRDASSAARSSSRMKRIPCSDGGARAGITATVIARASHSNAAPFRRFGIESGCATSL